MQTTSRDYQSTFSRQDNDNNSDNDTDNDSDNDSDEVESVTQLDCNLRKGFNNGLPDS